MSNPEFIKHDFNLPNHTTQISKATEVIEKHKGKYLEYQNSQQINDKEFLSLYEEIIRVLDYLGRLSMPAFAIESDIEMEYMKQFNKSPELAKKLWQDHYESIHHPYTLLKNRCYKLLEELDELYIAVNKKSPPNWNY